jgi:hypothetical protein
MAPAKVGGGTYDTVRVSSSSLGTGTTDNTNTMCEGDPAVLSEEALQNEALPFTRPPNQITHASFLSRLFVYWPYPLLKLGLERPLEEVDLPEILDVDSSNADRSHFDQIRAEEKSRNPDNPSLHRAFLRDFLKSFWYVQPLMGLAATAQIVQAAGLGFLIEAFETDNGQGYKWAGGLWQLASSFCLSVTNVYFVTWRKGMQMRISCVASIYANSLRLSSTRNKKRMPVREKS